ncbi:MAG: ABC transporter ATP-binding protein [Alphaproteobacteria bacterium]|jgi:lipoprotein-releasing system ATP-binding protein|uniref:ABC transporter ATP-binding protein n=1 Tax=Devosia sp. XGJD_8 TaxID=3391187 RepID=UPI001DC37561|nr:ABC transporter ATP-binding protein [Alphaproteobacteria bacterium]MBU1560852.1 ABC transporter ATP-binding protein [Alphaproteobacteria bacterium]MBU2304826.1 ABC transporter ATP-binding protein [Alphaproteobacteria bacterium]MBU2368018.1 ABC transporter ATP-binding protein [Alphaproteobacteria bacterium]
MSKPHLVLTDVHRHYGQGDKIVRVLEAANLTVQSGELVALVAPSGAGKSTLLHLSGLLESPQGGEVEIIGVKTSKLGDRGRTQLRRSTVGYVYQFHHLLPEFTALENVSMPQLIAGKSPAEANKRSMELLELLGIAQRASHRPAELSGGEQQRVAIARAAANHPKVILADEPTGNLDPETSDLVFGALANLIKNEGAAALIATHNHDLARRADRIVTLKGGLVVDHTL